MLRLLIVLAVLIVTGHARADNKAQVSAALRTSGLVGQWAEACEAHSAKRIFLIDQARGPLTEAHFPGENRREVSEIVDVQVVSTMVKLKQLALNPAHGTVQYTYVRQGQKIRMLDVQLESGAKLIEKGRFTSGGGETRWLERCGTQVAASDNTQSTRASENKKTPQKTAEKQNAENKLDGKVTVQLPSLTFDFLRSEVESCQDGVFGDWITTTVNQTDVRPEWFLDEYILAKMLEALKKKGETFCEAEQRAGRASGALGKNHTIRVGTKVRLGSQNKFEAKFSNNNWGISFNGFQLDAQQAAERERYQREHHAKLDEARRKADEKEAEEKRIAAAKKALFDEFVARHGVAALVGSKDLIANPFLYRGKTVGVPALFARMISESEAVFEGGTSVGGDIVVSKTPVTQFRGEEKALLAVRVRGTRTAKIAAVEVVVPDLEFVGVYVCKQNNCSDIF